jgi:hypothetical protein
MTTTSKGERHRAKLRAAGLRPLQIWVHDTRTPAISEQLARQCHKLKHDPAEREIIEFVEEAAAQTEGWR